MQPVLVWEKINILLWVCEIKSFWSHYKGIRIQNAIWLKSIRVLSVYKCILMSVLISLSFIIILVLLFCALSVKAHWPIAGWGWILCPRLLSTPSFTPSPVKAHTNHPHSLTPSLAACWVATSPLISAPLYQRPCKIMPRPPSRSPEALA